MNQEHEVQRAHPRARLIAISILVCGTVAGGVLILLAEAWAPEVRRWASEDPSLAPRRAGLILAFLGTAIVVPLVAFALYLWFLGRRILATKRFPPPFMMVIRDTPVVVDTQADARGRFAQAMAIVLALLAAAIVTFLYRLAGAI